MQNTEQTIFEDSLIDQLAGQWVLRGQIHGQETVHDIDAQWVLGHQYLRIDERSREKGERGNAAYEALVFIGLEQDGQRYTCLWLDNTGSWGLDAAAIGRAARGGNEIRFEFKDPDGTVGLTNTFAYDRGNDAWAWGIDNVQDGKATPFARVALTRK